MSSPQETGDMLVVTLPVPTTDARELSVSIDGHVVRVLGPGEFRREVNLPAGADGGRLQAGLFAGILELRAPRDAGASAPRHGKVEVRSLC
jgi:HSP20 family molecular chaperone IbpA